MWTFRCTPDKRRPWMVMWLSSHRSVTYIRRRGARDKWTVLCGKAQSRTKGCRQSSGAYKQATGCWVRQGERATGCWKKEWHIWRGAGLSAPFEEMLVWCSSWKLRRRVWALSKDSTGETRKRRGAGAGVSVVWIEQNCWCASLMVLITLQRQKGSQTGML